MNHLDYGQIWEEILYSDEYPHLLKNPTTSIKHTVYKTLFKYKDELSNRLDPNLLLIILNHHTATVQSYAVPVSYTHLDVYKRQ